MRSSLIKGGKIGLWHMAATYTQVFLEMPGANDGSDRILHLEDWNKAPLLPLEILGVPMSFSFVILIGCRLQRPEVLFRKFGHSMLLNVTHPRRSCLAIGSSSMDSLRTMCCYDPLFVSSSYYEMLMLQPLRSLNNPIVPPL